MDLLGEEYLDYSLEGLIHDLKIINSIKGKTIAFKELYDYEFKLYDPADASEIEQLTSFFKYKIPEDYLDFLRLTNGMRLQEQSQLYDIESAMIYAESGGVPEHMLRIGEFNSASSIYIHLTSDDNHYMYIMAPLVKTNIFEIITSHNIPDDPIACSFCQGKGGDFSMGISNEGSMEKYYPTLTAI